MTSRAIGIDVGGTKIAAGLVSFPEGKILTCQVRPTLPERGGDAVLKDVCDLAQALCADDSADAVGLAICELVDLRGNIVSNNCIAWDSATVVKRLAAIGPVKIEADVRAAALGEAQFGAGKAFKTFLYVTVGTGISSCLVIDGKSYVGMHGLTGTFASSALPSLDASLEELASGAGLVKRCKGQYGNAAEVLSATDSNTMQIVQRGAEALGAGIGLLINTLDPEAVIIGGGLGTSGGRYWDWLVASTRRHIWSPLQHDIPILATTTPHPAIIGAAAFALNS